MFNSGDKVRITEGIYEGREVEIAKVVAEDVTTSKYSSLNGYAVKGLTTPNATMSTFWDDQLEAV